MKQASHKTQTSLHAPFVLVNVMVNLDIDIDGIRCDPNPWHGLMGRPVVRQWWKIVSATFSLWSNQKVDIIIENVPVATVIQHFPHHQISLPRTDNRPDFIRMKAHSRQCMLLTTNDTPVIPT